MARTCQILAPLAAAFPDAKVSEATALVYASRLAKYPSDVLEEAVSQVIDTAFKFPPIARLKEIANRVLGERWGTRAPMLPAPKPSEKDIREISRLVKKAVKKLSMPSAISSPKQTWTGNEAFDSILRDGVDERRWKEIVEKQRRCGIV